jgi:flagellar export protein FliJ
VQQQFKFRLQNVLDWRTKELDTVQQQLNHELQHQAVLQRSINELEDHLEQTLNTPLNNEDDIIIAQQLTGYMHTLRLEKQQRQYHLSRQQHVVKAVQQQLHTAHQKQQVLEKLKEKKYAQFTDQQNKIDLETMEELAIRQYATQNNPLVR